VYTAPAAVPLSVIARAALLPAAAAEHALNNPQAIAAVEFFAGATLLGTVAGPRADNLYAFTWANPAPGTYAISARASNGKGDSAVSGTISVVVNAPPTVSLTTPAPVVTAPGTIDLSAGPADIDGTIQKVDFFRGATLVGTVTAAPFALQLQNQVAGTYTFSARVTDNHGATGDSGSVNVIVNEPPTVALSTPAPIVTAPGSFTLTAAAADADGSIQKVDFFRGTTLVGTATTAPYELQLTDLPSGTYNFTAVASDNHAAKGASAVVTVRVNSPPTVTLSSTATSFRAPASIPLTVSALDTDGTIAKVELFNGSDLIATLTADPFSATWSEVPQGAYTLIAVVTDDLGATFRSQAMVVTVTTTATKLYFIHVDHIDTPRLVADDQQRTVWRWDHLEPFGSHAPDSQPTVSMSFEVPLRFPGQYSDDETGTYQNGFRDYAPSLGRYLESDPIGLKGGPNTYLYVGGDPLLGVDILGLARFCCRLLNSLLIGRGLGYRHCYVVADDGTVYGLYPETIQRRKVGVPRTNDPQDVGGECFDCPAPECVDQDRCLRLAHSAYPVGMYSAARGPNSNTYAGTLARRCCDGGVPNGVRDAPGIDATPPAPLRR
jgi:RHS repeat-associated protein